MNYYEVSMRDYILHFLASNPSGNLKEEFTFNMGRLEHEGVETLEEVRDLLKQGIYDDLTDKQRVTINIAQALEYSESLCLDGVFSLTLDHLNGWHSKLYSTNSTKLRTIQVCSGYHWYPAVSSLEDGLKLFLSHFNKFAYDVSQCTSERLDETIKWAEWSLVNFLALHPYEDGNGRVGRLLCNYVLSSIFPFPVPAFYTTRDEYLTTLIKAHNCPCATTTLKCLTFDEHLERFKSGPLYTMILEWCWYTCCYLKDR